MLEIDTVPLSDLIDRLKPAEAMWEKYRHLDHLLGDVQWLGEESNWRAEIMRDLWLAVRAAAGHA